MIWQSASSYLRDTLFPSRYVWVLGCVRAWWWVLIPTCKTQGMTTCLAQPWRDGMFWTSSGTHHKVNLWEDGKNMSHHIKNKLFSHSAEEKLICLIWLLILFNTITSTTTTTPTSNNNTVLHMIICLFIWCC